MATPAAPTVSPAVSATPAEGGETSRVMAMLGAGIPLSLLVDLAAAPDSAAIARDERGETTWIRLSA
jgi:hypothetical protein